MCVKSFVIGSQKPRTIFKNRARAESNMKNITMKNMMRRVRRIARVGAARTVRARAIHRARNHPRIPKSFSLKIIEHFYNKNCNRF
jgi:hypothetical protein